MSTSSSTTTAPPTHDLIITPDIYTPSIDDKGNFYDKVFSIPRHGIYCDCGTRINKVYYTLSSFNVHRHSKRHIEWIKQLNNNKINYLLEIVNLKKNNENQKMIIAKQQNDIENQKLTISILSNRIQEMKNINNAVSINLIDDA
jgi:hypothetical protein